MNKKKQHKVTNTKKEKRENFSVFLKTFYIKKFFKKPKNFCIKMFRKIFSNVFFAEVAEILVVLQHYSTIRKS